MPRARPTVKRSIVWAFFDGAVDSKTIICKICNKLYTNSGNTSNFRDHLSRMHPEQFHAEEERRLAGTKKQDTSNSGNHQEKRMGPDGDKKCTYVDSDELMSKIMNRDSHNSRRSESVRTECSGSNAGEDLMPPMENNSTQENPFADTPMIFAQAINDRIKTEQHSSSENSDSEEPRDLLKDKLKAEISLLKEKSEIAKRERYKLDLELLRMERELNVKRPSKFTVQFYQEKIKARK